MPKALKIALTSSCLEYEIARIREKLSVKETEDTWENIARAIEELAGLLVQGGNDFPDQFIAALRAVALPLNSAMSSERSRLSAVALSLLASAASELGHAFDPLIPIFFPVLLSLCSRPNKVFVTRARSTILAIVQSTQSPLILSYLTRNAKDKSVALRSTVAETALACLNSFNPPDLQRETRSKEVELLIRCAATDANAEVRKTGKNMYEAYRILLPERVDNFTAPLTPTIRKYLNIGSRPAKPQVRPHPPSNTVSVPPRPASSLSTRSGLASSSSSVPADVPHVHLQPPPSSSLSTLPSQSATSLQTEHPVVPARPHTVLGQVSSSSLQRHSTREAVACATEMPPPEFIPSRPRAPSVTSTTQPGRTTTNMHLPEQRSRTGPLRPTRTDHSTTAPTYQDTGAPEIRRGGGGGARRVLLPAGPPVPHEISQTKPQNLERKGPARPPPSREGPDGEGVVRTAYKQHDKSMPSSQQDTHSIAPSKNSGLHPDRRVEKPENKPPAQPTKKERGLAPTRYAPNTTRAQTARTEPVPKSQSHASHSKLSATVQQAKLPSHHAAKSDTHTNSATNITTRRKAASKMNSQQPRKQENTKEAGPSHELAPKEHRNRPQDDKQDQEAMGVPPSSSPTEVLQTTNAQVVEDTTAEDVHDLPVVEIDSTSVTKSEPPPREEIQSHQRRESLQRPEVQYRSIGTAPGPKEDLERDNTTSTDADRAEATASPSSPPVPPTPPNPIFRIDVEASSVTPKALPSSHSTMLAVQQTPISALVDSIQHGFTWTPRPGDDSLICTSDAEDEWEGDTTFKMDSSSFDFEATRFLTTQPLSWGSLNTSESLVGEDAGTDQS